MSARMLDELLSALSDAAGSPEARVVLVSGEGVDFCAGADLAELQAAARDGAAAEYGRRLERVLGGIGEHPLPVVAVIHGAALGAGCQIAIACDLAIVAADARLGIPSARLGVILNRENIERLVAAAGPKRAADMLVTGRTVSGEEAVSWGLASEAVTAEALEERGGALADRIASGAPLSVRGSKRGIRSVLDGDGRAAFDELVDRAFASEDLAEGIRAARERRSPEFRGR